MRPIGVGANCLCCGDRRRVHLRHFELPRTFIVLCHNCAARVQAMPMMPRSPEGLLERMGRERRVDARRAGGENPLVIERRRRVERRVGARDLFDATELAVEEVEEAEEAAPVVGDVTRVHFRV